MSESITWCNMSLVSTAHSQTLEDLAYAEIGFMVAREPALNPAQARCQCEM